MILTLAIFCMYSGNDCGEDIEMFTYTTTITCYNDVWMGRFQLNVAYAFDKMRIKISIYL